MASHPPPKPVLYTTYAKSSIVLYHIVTILHFLWGGIGLYLAFQSTILSAAYLGFALVQMIGIMPWRVCPNCLYVNLGKPSNNPMIRRLTKMGDPAFYSQRSRAVLKHNNLYILALLLPIVVVLPVLIVDFSMLLLLSWLAVVGLLLFRFSVILGDVPCLRCKAKHECSKSKVSQTKQG